MRSMNRGTPFAVRPISAHERAVLERVVRLAPCDDVDMPPLEQLDSLQVVGTCACGCATVNFQPYKQGEVPELVADGVAETPSGDHVGVLVFALDGAFVCLEIVGYGDDPAPLPVVSSVSGWNSLATKFSGR